MMLLAAMLSALMTFSSLQVSPSAQPPGPVQGGAVLTGRVLDPSGQPMRNLHVTAYSKRLTANGRPVPSPVVGQPMLFSSGRAETNALGEFRLSGLSAGEYLLAADVPMDFRAAAYAPGFVALATFFPDTTDASRAQSVPVRDGEAVADLVIHMVSAPAFQLSGVVVDETGTPFANVLVNLSGAAAGTYPLFALTGGGTSLMSLGSVSNAAGQFSFSAMPAGFYTLIATEVSRRMSTSVDIVVGADGVPRFRPQPGSVEVTITTANVENVRIGLPRSR